MPVHVEKKNGLYRIVEADGKIAKTKNGKSRDGGGHKDKMKAFRQAGYINK